MQILKRRPLLLAALWLGFSCPAVAQSVFTTRLDDPGAVYLTRQEFGAQGDGTSDDSAALQSAIDKAGASPGGGIVFVPAGRYRVTRTIYVWRSVRVIGYGATRPVLVLADNTPGFQTGMGLMVLFSASGPAVVAQGGRGGRGRVPFPPPGTVPPNENAPDANQGTFYSAMMNIDVEIGAGNPAAVAIRFHVAQHGVLSHMDFHLGSGLAALTEIGNVAYDLRFYGGRYAILTTNTSPFWPFTLLDSVFEGQRAAAIREHMAGLTLIRDSFRNVPVAIEIDPEFSDQLWVKDNRFENISDAVVMISNDKNPTTQVGFENAVCANAPVFARFRDSAKTQPGAGAIYRVASFSHGLMVPSVGTTGQIGTRYSAQPLKALPGAMPRALRGLPATENWVNVQTLGVKGDGKTDDTEAIRKAIDAHPVLYFPAGYYIVRDTIAMKKETVLIALHPGTTQLDLPDSSPAYSGAGAPRALLEAPQGGSNIVTGIGIFTGGINPRAAGIVWMAGEDSLMDDVHIHGAGGTFLPPAVRTAFYNAGRGGAFTLPGRLGAQYASVWVTRGGGGTFTGVWTPNTFARTGFYVSDTTTPGHVYELSAEHHLFSEIKLDRVENWDFYGPQTEEEVSTSAEAVSLEVTASKNITFANYHAYRVARSYAPARAAARLFRSSEIHFRNVHINAEHGYAACDEGGCGTFLRAGKFAYENAVEDVTHHLQVREREFAVLDVRPSPAPAARAVSTMTAPGARVETLASGFHSISGGAVDARGRVFFVDHYEQRIYSWSRDEGLVIVRDDPIDAVNLAVDKSGHLLVMSSAGPEGSVYSVMPDGPHDELSAIAAQPRASHAGSAVLVPGTIWVDGQFSNYLDLKTYQYTTLGQMFAREVTTTTEKEYVSPDGSLVLPARRVFRQGPDGSYPGMDESGWRWSHNLGAYNFVAAAPGRRIYVTSGAENRTYSATTQGDGTLRDLKPFAERGGETVAVDAKGNVYIANGQIFVYDPSGKMMDEIDVPDRPIGLLFGGPDRRTLIILTHRALYGVKTREAGEALPWVQ